MFTTDDLCEIYDCTVVNGEGHDRIVINVDYGIWQHYESKNGAEVLVSESRGHDGDLLRLIGLYIQSAMEGESTYGKLDI